MDHEKRGCLAWLTVTSNGQGRDAWNCKDQQSHQGDGRDGGAIEEHLIGSLRLGVDGVKSISSVA